MLGIFGRIVQVQFFALCLLVLCIQIGGEKNGMGWFLFVMDSFVVLFVASAIIKHRKRRRVESMLEECPREKEIPTATRCTSRYRHMRQGHDSLGRSV